MNFNTTEYQTSILKKLDEKFNEITKKLVIYAQIKNEDKMPEELFNEIYLKNFINTIKLIKAELIRENDINYHTNKEYKNNLNQETKVLLKMSNNHKETMEAYKNANNQKAYQNEKIELDIIQQFIPTQPTNKEITDFTINIIKQYLNTKDDNYVLSMRDMGQIMPKVKNEFPNVDGNLIKTILQNYEK